MPDLKTALQSAFLKNEINQWDQEENQRMNHKQTISPKTGKAVFGITNNVARECFASVKNNPGLTSTQHNALLTKRGFKESSTTSILSQLVRQGQVRKDEDRRLFTTVSEYQPLKTTKKVQPKRNVVVVKKKEVGNTHQPSSAGIGELLRKKMEMNNATLWSPENVVNTLNVIQARQLYDYLKHVFGG